jgi:hypothetical protein
MCLFVCVCVCVWERFEGLCLFVYIHKYIQVRACVCSFVSVVGACTCILFLTVSTCVHVRMVRCQCVCCVIGNLSLTLRIQSCCFLSVLFYFLLLDAHMVAALLTRLPSHETTFTSEQIFVQQQDHTGNRQRLPVGPKQLCRFFGRQSTAVLFVKSQREAQRHMDWRFHRPSLQRVVSSLRGTQAHPGHFNLCEQDLYTTADLNFLSMVVNQSTFTSLVWFILID